jgi:septum formation protein
VIEPDVEELERGPAEDVAVENAWRKAAVVGERSPRAVVLAVDTVVSLDGTVYGKPADAVQAGRTLRALSGRRHTVTSGICVIEAGRLRTDRATTAVEFRLLDERLVEWYVGHEEWRGRAGGYAIQGRGAALVSAIEGDYLNVVGLPVATLFQLIPGLLTDFQI